MSNNAVFTFSVDVPTMCEQENDLDNKLVDLVEGDMNYQRAGFTTLTDREGISSDYRNSTTGVCLSVSSVFLEASKLRIFKAFGERDRASYAIDKVRDFYGEHGLHERLV